MAHADYNCCAICDSKMGYCGFYDAGTKDDICDDCFDKMKELGLDIKNVDDFKTYVENANYKELKKNLLALEFRFCYYGNDIDDAVLLRFQPTGISLESYIKAVEEVEE